MKLLKNIIEKTISVRADNLDKHKRIKFFLVLFYPLFTIIITELVQMNSLPKLIHFMVTKPNIIAFDIIVISMVFGGLALITRRITLSMTICSLLFYLFSIVEYFKYLSSGLHFSIIDITMSLNVGDVASFAQIHATPALIVGALMITGYLSSVFLLNIKYRPQRNKAITGGVCTIALFMAVLCFEPIYSGVYSFFDINTSPDTNMFVSDDKFSNNALIATIAASVSQQVASKVTAPDEYSPEAVQALLKTDAEKSTASETVFPNVVVIMSESFADLRKFEQLNVSNEIYSGFDYVKENGFSSYTIVPTFGGGTVKTEFELLFGLPVKSLNNAALPQNLLDADLQQETLARFFGRLDYNTAYIHPYKSEFYSRDTVYPEYGFDELYFIDDIDNSDIEESYHYGFIDDKTIFNHVEKLIADSDSPAYIHATTMQNHKPYYNPEFTGGTELDYYLNGIEKSCNALRELYDNLQNLDEPTVVLFVGDHYPFFSMDFNIYDMVGITSENCEEIYTQPYVIFDNYGANYTGVVPELVSTFYLPHITAQIAGVPMSNFTVTSLQKMADVPVYTEMNGIIASDDELDMLTYDRTVGERYSEDN